jgi:ribulose-phosphate 3-epimerase
VNLAKNAKNIKIAASVLAADFANLGNDIKQISNYVDYIHIDVMDGHFVPNITIGPSIIKALRPYSSLPFDVHLMIANPERYIHEFVAAGANIITIHAEACIHLDRCLNLIKSYGIMAGISLVPSSHPNRLDYVLELADLVLLMTVNPGFGGQVFIENQFSKISQVREKINQSRQDIILAVDGGVNSTNAKKIIDHGADLLVAGKQIFKSGAAHYASNVNQLRT